MKSTNPIAQLQQWKANNTKKLVSDGGVSVNGVHPNALKIGLVKSTVKNATLLKNQERLKTQQETQGEGKHKHQGKLSFNPLHAEYAQISRQFKLIHDSNQRCLEVYPDEFHHKLKMRGECVDLVDRLKGGGKLFNELAKAANLTKEQTALLKSFNQANGYLISKFSEVVTQIERLHIEHIALQKLRQGGE